MTEEIQKSVQYSGDYDQWLEDYKKTVQYGLDYDRWMEDFEGTPKYMSIVTEHNCDWRKIYDA